MVYYVYLPSSQTSPVKGFLQLHVQVWESNVPPFIHSLPAHGANIIEKRGCIKILFAHGYRACGLTNLLRLM